MNKNGGGDVKTLAFSVLTFIVVLGGGIALATNFLFSAGIDRSGNFQAIEGNFTGDGSSGVNYLKNITDSQRDDSGVDEQDTNWVEEGVIKIRDRFEDSMLRKAFVTVKVLLGSDGLVSDVENNEGLASVFYLKEVSWVAWSLGIFISLLFLFAVIYFFRGLNP